MTPSVHRRASALPGAAVLLALGLLATGCVPQEDDGGSAHASAADRVACAERADTVFRLRNPDVVYRQDTYDTSTRDTPFNGAGLSSVPTEGLSSQYERDQLLRGCLNGGGGTSPDAPTPDEQGPAQPAPSHGP
jgi:hypothetical protein